MAKSRVPGRKSQAADVMARLKRDKEAAFAAFNTHARHCHPCSKASSVTASYCDTGWQLAKARARAIFAYDNPASTMARYGDQGTLF